MLRFWLTALIFFAFAQNAFADLQCNPNDEDTLSHILSGERRANMGFGEFRQSWADEISGKDIADESLKSIRNRAQVNVGLVDSGFEAESIQKHSLKAGAYVTNSIHSHGTGVMNTMMSRTDADISALFSWEEMRNPNRVKAKLDELESRGLLPKVMNISYSLGSLDEVHQSFLHMAEKGILLVASAGNAGSKELDLNNQRFPGLIVGSSSLHGTAADYSQGGAAVDLLAPTDHYFEVDFGKSMKGPAMAMGTSFASPQVAAIMADLVSILPGISAGEIETLLKKTAIPTVQTKTGQHGAGVVNAFKAIEVAKRLQQTWPSSRERLKEDGLYDFQAEARNFERLAQSGSVHERERNLRKSFALNPSENVRKQLVDLYLSPELRLEGMARYYEGLKADDAHLASLVADGSLPDSQRQAAARALKEIRGVEHVARLALAQPPLARIDLRQTSIHQKLIAQVASSDSQAYFASEVLSDPDFKRLNLNESALSNADAAKLYGESKSEPQMRVALAYLSNQDRRKFYNQAKEKGQTNRQADLVGSYEWSTEPSEEDFDFLMNLDQELNIDPKTYEQFSNIPVRGIYFDEPDALRPFVKNWYFSRIPAERIELWSELERLLEVWRLEARDSRRQILKLELNNLQNDKRKMPITRQSAEQSLRLLK